jgi:hypothetical protein
MISKIAREDFMSVKYRANSRTRPNIRAKSAERVTVSEEPPKYWKVAPGKNAIYWDECREGGYMCVGWSKMGNVANLDLSTFQDRQRRLYPSDPAYSVNGTRQLWTFTHDIKVGHKIIANRGKSEALGIGTVTGPFYFAKAEREGFPNRLPVTWEDTRVREVNEEGWINTVRRLDRQKFEAIYRLQPKNNSTKEQLEPNQDVPSERWQRGLYPDEVSVAEKFLEGATRQVTVNAYERSGRARAACLAHYGAICQVCDLNFAKRYGKLGDGFIHVHHLRQLAEIGNEYRVDPINDLLPVCPNCHAMLHQNTPPLKVDALRRLMKNAAS